MKKPRFLYTIGYIFSIFVFSIIFYLFTRTYVISEFYLYFTVCVIGFLVVSFIMYCLIKKKCPYLFLLSIIILCVLSSCVCMICRSQVESSTKKKALDGSTLYFEKHNFPQHQIIVKKKTFFCFSKNCGKLITPTEGKYQITVYDNKLIIIVNRNNEEIRYHVDVENCDIIQISYDKQKNS